MDKMERVWVSSRTSRPVHLVDLSFVMEDGDYLRISISERMAREGIPVLVPKTTFVQGYYSDPINLLEMWTDVDAARKKHDAFFKVTAAEAKEQAEEKRQQEKAENEAMKAALDSYNREIEKQKLQKTGGQPKIIRKRPGEEESQKRA